MSLTPELEAFVRKEVESGLYNNASEVVRDALRLLAQAQQPRARRQTLEELVNEGIESYRQHGGIEVNEQFWEGVRERGMRMAAEGAPIPWYISGESDE